MLIYTSKIGQMKLETRLNVFTKVLVLDGRLQSLCLILVSNKCLLSTVSPQQRYEKITIDETGKPNFFLQGGRHVDHVVDGILKNLSETLKKKNKSGIDIKPHQVLNCYFF